jgi:fructosamine-3-kinase
MGIEPHLAAAIADATGGEAVGTRPLADGHTGALTLVTLADGRRLVAKAGQPGADLALEGFMLEHLARHSALPVPRVHVCRADLLVMDHLPGGGGLTAEAQTHAAELLADLHGRAVDRYGFPRDTLIGPLPQPNPESDDWIAFFRDHRLLAMARAAHAEGGLDAGLLGRIERLAERLDALIGEPAPPALIHGDVWGGNVLAEGGRITGFIDPAIYHADPEIELAFSTLFGTFGESFFRRYAELRPLRPGFFEVRRDLYNLYPLLVHVRLFGRSYLGPIERTVGRLLG